MAKSFWQSIITWFFGCSIGLLLTLLVFKIGWENKEHILILGYGGLASLIGIYIKFSSALKKAELLDIEKKITHKIDHKDLENIQQQIDSLHEMVRMIVKSQEEQHATIDNIYHLLVSNKKK